MSPDIGGVGWGGVKCGGQGLKDSSNSNRHCDVLKQDLQIAKAAILWGDWLPFLTRDQFDSYFSFTIK